MFHPFKYRAPGMFTFLELPVVGGTNTPANRNVLFHSGVQRFYIMMIHCVVVSFPVKLFILFDIVFDDFDSFKIKKRTTVISYFQY